MRLFRKDIDGQVDMHALEEFSVYDIPYLRQYNNNQAEHVIMQSCLPRLREAVGQYCDIDRLIDPMKPNPGEINVYGIQTVKAMACRRFLESTVKAIRTGSGESFIWCYRDLANSVGLEGRLEVMLRTEDMDEERIEGNEDDCSGLKAYI